MTKIMAAITVESTKMKTNLFELGTIAATPGALTSIPSRVLGDILARHQAGDWGDVCFEDAKTNDDAVNAGDRILSVYVVDGVSYWVITESDRSVTTVLLPEEH